jgi:hypothetical protein
VFILQTDAKSIQYFQKHAKLIENQFSRSKVQLTRVECGNFSQDTGTPGTERVIVFSQLAVKGLITLKAYLPLAVMTDQLTRELVSLSPRAALPC